jgi:DNA-binding MarR family transcriptional regulator
MSRESRQELLAAIGDAFRVNQNKADVFDDVASEILRINRTDMRAMDIVSRRGRVTAGELAEEAGLTTGGVTAVVDRMERAGLLKRARDPDDRRRVWLETTPLVLEKTMPIWGPMQELWKSRARDLSRDQLAFLLRFLTDSNEMMDEQIERLRQLRDEGQG